MSLQQSLTKLTSENPQDEKAINKGVSGHIRAYQRLKEYRQDRCREKNQEVRRLISFQSTALQAIHLQSIMQPLKISRPKDPLSKPERERLDKILQEERKWLNITFN